MNGIRALASAVVAIAVVGSILVSPAQAHVSEQMALLRSGSVEPGPGPNKGSGAARIRSASEIDTVCYKLTFENIGKATAAHIHEGESGQTGDVVVDFFSGTTERPSPQDGCIRQVPAGLIESMQSHPQSYYVDVHTSDFPDGAIRGQMRNLAGSYTPPSNCGRFVPSVPNSPSGQKSEARKARVRRVTDAAIESSPVKTKYSFGPSLWEPETRTPVSEDTFFVNLQVDTASATRGLFIRASWAETSTSDLELVLYDGAGEQVAISDANNLLPVAPPAGASDYGTGGPGYEQLSGYEASDCSGYTLEVRALRTTGEEVTLSVWLGNG